ncbi:hypothetical protein BK136_09205 [Paenibacillus amylolyticus]|nr:hypothetical protein BK136_09205 [Paenibacillus amylolyticus]
MLAILLLGSLLLFSFLWYTLYFISKRSQHPDRSSAIVLRIILSISTLTLIVQVYNLKGNPYNFILIFVFIASLIATRSFIGTNKNR